MTQPALCHRKCCLSASAFYIHWRRNVILATLVIQNSLTVVLMRYSRTSQGPHAPRYRAVEAVLASEALKLPMSLAMAAHALGGVRPLWRLLRMYVPTSGTLKCGVPAFAYTIQSNLLFIATANLEAPTFQVTYQTKTLFTALFSVLLLRRRLKPSQWVALVLLFLGTVLASDVTGSPKGAVPSSSPKGDPLVGLSSSKGDPVVGLLAVLSAAILSASASVYFEVMLKTELPLAPQVRA